VGRRLERVLTVWMSSSWWLVVSMVVWFELVDLVGVR
jgi:hypothetical protein